MSDILGEPAYLCQLPVHLRVIQRNVVVLVGLGQGQMISIDHDVLAINLWEEVPERLERSQELFLENGVFLLCVTKMGAVEAQRLVVTVWAKHLE